MCRPYTAPALPSCPSTPACSTMLVIQRVRSLPTGRLLICLFVCIVLCLSILINLLVLLLCILLGKAQDITIGDQDLKKNPNRFGEKLQKSPLNSEWHVVRHNPKRLGDKLRKSPLNSEWPPITVEIHGVSVENERDRRHIENLERAGRYHL